MEQAQQMQFGTCASFHTRNSIPWPSFHPRNFRANSYGTERLERLLEELDPVGPGLKKRSAHPARRHTLTRQPQQPAAQKPKYRGRGTAKQDRADLIS